MLGAIVSSQTLSPALSVLTGLTSFRILILGATSGLVETITDAVSIHSIKKAEYAKRLAQNKLGHVTLMDHFKSVSRVSAVRIPTDLEYTDLRRPILR